MESNKCPQLALNNSRKNIVFLREKKMLHFLMQAQLKISNQILHPFLTAKNSCLEASKIGIFLSQIIELLHLENISKYNLKSRKLQLPVSSSFLVF